MTSLSTSQLSITGDAAAVIEYIASKFMAGGDEGRKARALSQVEMMSAQLSRLVESLKA